MRCSPSGVNAQFFERAARSTTSSRSAFGSINMDAENVRVRQQLFRHDVELPGWSGELELVVAIFRVIEDPLPQDLDPAVSHHRLDLVRGKMRFRADGAAQDAARPPQAPAAPQVDRKEIGARLVALVSDRTGYPAEMLTPEQDMEADLGIDSIKRVEILTSFARQFPELPPAVGED